MPTRNNARPQVSVRYFRSLCEKYIEPNLIDKAIQNGWTPRTITDLAVSYRQRGSGYFITNPELARLQAMRRAASSRYISSEGSARNRAELQAHLEADNARRAIVATDETRPTVPRTLRPYRSACKTMLDCDRLSVLLTDNWQRDQLDQIARYWRRGKDITASKRRWAMAFAAGRPAGQCPSYLGGSA